MSILFLTLEVLCWIGLVILGLFIFVETIIRLIKHFIDGPSLPFVPYLINNPIRRKFWPPSMVIDRLTVREGMKILEVGPGSGFYNFVLAEYTGPSGHVYAVDIEPKMITVLEKKIKRAGIKNISTVIVAINARFLRIMK